MKKITIVTPVYNELENIPNLLKECDALFEDLNYKQEHIFIDNDSSDGTQDLLRNIAKKRKNIKIIINSRNFGHIRSPFHALKQADGDAVVLLFADLQDPPSLIKKFIQEWENGYPIICGVKNSSKENIIMFKLRKLYYKIINKISAYTLIENFNGFGLYDKKIINQIKTFNDPEPYFRGIISEIGFSKKIIKYDQNVRHYGKTKNNLFTLYDLAMIAFTDHTKFFLRALTFLGFFMSIISIIVAIFYTTLKLFYWNTFQMGIAPLVIGFFIFNSIILIFLGLIGEYIINILNRIKNRPHVIEKERINFDL